MRSTYFWRTCLPEPRGTPCWELRILQSRQWNLSCAQLLYRRFQFRVQQRHDLLQLYDRNGDLARLTGLPQTQTEFLRDWAPSAVPISGVARNA